jgi:hypothetical protein
MAVGGFYSKLGQKCDDICGISFHIWVHLFTDHKAFRKGGEKMATPTSIGKR